MSADNYGKAIEVLCDIVERDPSQLEDAKAIAESLNWMHNEQVMLPGETCFYCGYEHVGAPGYACNGGQDLD
jgi:hypothetical protein